MMKTFAKTFAKLTTVAILFCLFSLPCFAELQRVPAASIVEQGLTAITVDAEGADNFRYVGQKEKMHTYVGKIKPESKLKLVIRGALKNEKELPITGRSILVRMQVTVKKGDKVIKTQNFRKENLNRVFLNYTVPKDADTLEVIESFALTNKSEDSKFNQKVTTVNKLILSARDEVLAAASGQPVNTNSPDKKASPDSNKNKDGSNKNAGNADGKSSKSPEKNAEAEASERFTRIVSGTAFLVLLGAVGIHFFLKNKKSNLIASDRLARKQQLRLQAIERQKQLKQDSRPEETQEEEQRTDSPFEDTFSQEDPQQDLPQADAPNAPAAAGMAQALYCQNCGAPLKPDSKFCENCGSKV